jgi:hypothetical protein
LPPSLDRQPRRSTPSRLLLSGIELDSSGSDIALILQLDVDLIA